jgi:hypothetical protein
MKWKIGDHVAVLSRVNRRRTEPECVRILSVAKVTPAQIVLEDGSRYRQDGLPVGPGYNIGKATAADEVKIADQVEKRKAFVKEMAGRDEERRRILSLFPQKIMPSVSIHENNVDLTFNVTVDQAEQIAKLLSEAKLRQRRQDAESPVIMRTGGPPGFLSRNRKCADLNQRPSGYEHV